MRVLVTGGAGFIGSHLVSALVARGDRVRVLDDLSTGRLENLEPFGEAVELRREDVRDARAVRAAVAGMDGVLHQAAVISVPRSVEDPAETLDINVTGTARVLEACRHEGVRRFVLASSCAVYGDTDVPACHEDLPPRPASPYAVSKLAGEMLVAVASRLHGTAGVSLRYFNVYGARQDPRSAYAAAIPRFTEALAAGRPPTLFGDGCQTRDFVHVSDVARANLRALDAPESAWGRSFNIGTGRSVSLNALLAALRDALRAAGHAGPLPEAVHDAPRAGDLRHSLADVRRAATELGHAAMVGLEDGLAQTVPRPRA